MSISVNQQYIIKKQELHRFVKCFSLSKVATQILI